MVCLPQFCGFGPPPQGKHRSDKLHRLTNLAAAPYLVDQHVHMGPPEVSSGTAIHRDGITMTSKHLHYVLCTDGNGNGDTVSSSDAAIGDTELRGALYVGPADIVAAGRLSSTGMYRGAQR